MDIVCPNCKEQLKELGSSGKFFRCPNEDIFWELCRDLSGDYLRTYSAPGRYKGPMIGRVETIRTGEGGMNDK